MKQVTTYLSVMALAGLLLPAAGFAQQVNQNNDQKDNKEKEVQQIIITRKGDKTDKVNIEINGDKVTINGKPAEDMKDGDITVDTHIIKMKKMAPMVRMYRNGDDRDVLLLNEDENRAMLGVVTDTNDSGVEVREVSKESGAEKAGLKEGDIITKVDDKKIENPDDLTKVIQSHKPGDKVIITFLRDKKEQKVTAELTKWKGMTWSIAGNGQNFNFRIPEFENMMPKVEALPRVPRMDGFGDLWQAYEGRPRLGMSVQDTEDGKGVKVIDVDGEGNAEKAGIKEDDIITSINNKEVNSADEVAKMVKENKDKPSIMVKLKRDGKTMNVEVKMPRKLKTADL
jgi:serine protease Do